MTPSEKRMAQFLYVLMRDYLPCGDAEEIVAKHVEAASGKEVSFTNRHLGMYACELSKRISHV